MHRKLSKVMLFLQILVTKLSVLSLGKLKKNLIFCEKIVGMFTICKRLRSASDFYEAPIDPKLSVGHDEK